MKVLVTGATGFIGLHLLNRLIKTGYTVRVLVRKKIDCSKNHSPEVEVIRGDIQNYEDVEEAIKGCSLVFHLAVDRGNYAVTVTGSENIAIAAIRAGIDRMVFASTGRVFRRIQGLIINENTPISPDPGHGAYKAAAEKMLMKYWDSDRLPVVIARLTVVLGPEGKSWRSLIQAIACGEFRMIGTGENHYQPVDVSDVVEGLYLCGTVPNIEGKTFILAGQKPRQLRDIICIIEKEFDTTTVKSAIPTVVFRAYRALNDIIIASGGNNLPRIDRISLFFDDKKYDLSRARTELGYLPKISLEETIQRIADYYRKQGLIPLQNRPVSSN